MFGGGWQSWHFNLLLRIVEVFCLKKNQLCYFITYYFRFDKHCCDMHQKKKKRLYKWVLRKMGFRLLFKWNLVWGGGSLLLDFNCSRKFSCLWVRQAFNSSYLCAVCVCVCHVNSHTNIPIQLSVSFSISIITIILLTCKSSVTNLSWQLFSSCRGVLL